MEDIFNLSSQDTYTDRGMLKYNGFILKEHRDTLKEFERLYALVDKPVIDEQAMQENLQALKEAHADNRGVTVKVFQKANLRDYLTVTDRDSVLLRDYEGMGEILTLEWAVPVYFETDSQMVQFELPVEVMERIAFDDILVVY
ncbi:YolD-like family protein [Listeria monocytogenes]|uniref:YolD-like family protein n=1 Tax=Listeria monocytogenes TaxID=1639 RepID=UPI003F97437C